MSRIALVCPGRGSYTEASLRSLDSAHPWVQRAETLRAEYGLDSLLSLDGASKFVPAQHLRPANVSALIYLVSMLGAERAWATGEVVCVLGNSMGWYTALAASGALSFDDGFHLVQRMALLQESGQAGGQLIYPLVDEDWRPVPERAEAVAAALLALQGSAFPSIHLAGYTVLAGDEAGLAGLRKLLPPVQQGGVPYPMRLAQHGPYHTPLAQGVADEAERSLAGLNFQLPTSSLVDGRGVMWSPWSSDLTRLRAYTLGDQVTKPYDFGASLTVALKEFAPDRLVLLAPGNTLGGIVGQTLVRMRWHGIDSRQTFTERQAGSEAMVESQGRGR